MTNDRDGQLILRRRFDGLRGPGMLSEPHVPQQSALRVVAQAHRHSAAQTAAGDHRVVLREDQVFDRRGQPAELRAARHLQREVIFGHFVSYIRLFFYFVPLSRADRDRFV